MMAKKKLAIMLLASLVLILFIANVVTRAPIMEVEKDTYSFASAPAQETKKPELRLSMMVTATVMAPEAVMFEGGSWFKSRKMGHSAILLCHPDALLMFDTGLGRDIDQQFKAMPFYLKPLFSYEILKPATEQLDIESFCPGRKLQIALSHLHWDHASGIEDFKGAPVWTPAEELSSGRNSGNKAGYLGNQFDSSDIQWKPLDFKKQNYENYKNSLDFFGDGSVIFVPMGGHTKGSAGMFVNFADGRRFFFTGDTSWSLEGFARPAHKHALMRKIVDGNVSETEQELRRVHALMQLYPDLHVIPAHDYNAYVPAAIYPDYLVNN